MVKRQDNVVKKFCMGIHKMAKCFTNFVSLLGLGWHFKNMGLMFPARPGLHKDLPVAKIWKYKTRNINIYLKCVHPPVMYLAESFFFNAFLFVVYLNITIFAYFRNYLAHLIIHIIYWLKKFGTRDHYTKRSTYSQTLYTYTYICICIYALPFLGRAPPGCKICKYCNFSLGPW